MTLEFDESRFLAERPNIRLALLVVLGNDRSKLSSLDWSASKVCSSSMSVIRFSVVFMEY